ncbi:efflux RND transporter permease subunit, partial [Ligaoa zhengdingensis]
RYIVTVTGQPAESAKNRGKNEITVSDEINAEVAKLALPEGVSLEQSDMQEQMQEEFSALFGAIATAVLLVFMVMTMQFESARFSGLVMLCIPFCLIGSFGLMWLTGTTVSMISLMGLLMLVGTVVNNGILFIDTANQLRASMDAETALIYAGRTRLRPILMTTLTTILSMVPMAIGIGESAELMRGMAVVIIGGLIASTLLTLLLIPSFYLLFDGKKKKPSGDEPEEQPQQSLEEMREIDYLMDSES